MKTSSIKYNASTQKGTRFDASFHLSDGLVTKRLIESSPYPLKTIGDVSSRIFFGNRAKRVYVTKKENGIPFLSSSDILRSDLENVKLASKKYMPVSDMMLEKGWTLISRSGTIGNCAFANAKHAQKLASEDVIRAVPNNILRGGLVYAYLASKYGYSLLTQGTFGAVIQHIEPDFVSSIPIPSFPEDFQNKINDLVLESARLREEATDALDKAHKIIEKTFLSDEKISSPKVKISTILKSHNTRFEASYYTSRNRAIYDHITSNCEFSTLSELTEDIFRPGIFKREYVKKGVAFLGGADILLSIPDSEKKLSFRQVDRLPELKVKKGWILVTCGGTIGNCVLIDEQLEKCVVSQHVMRVVPKESTLIGYLYAMLSSKVGHELITIFTAGSVIPQIESHHLGLVPIPILEQSSMVYIDSLIETYTSKNELSKKKECIAISLVEQEIEKWNK